MQLQVIQNKIYELRDQKIILDFDLAALYQVEMRVLKQAVRRNIDRFPDDFMFQLDNSDIDLLVLQNVIPSKSHQGGALPFAFNRTRRCNVVKCAEKQGRITSEHCDCQSLCRITENCIRAQEYNSSN